MLKEGKYRAIRNIPTGWILQALHSTDRSEKVFRIFMEWFVLLPIFLLAIRSFTSFSVIAQIGIAVILNHTVAWFLTGNFWVYMLDSFKFVKNPGLPEIIKFVEMSHKYFTAFDCVDGILIYGSACRNMFHIRSDLDLRIVRRQGLFRGLMALILGYWVRSYSFFIRMPVDLQVVDSFQFLRQQMRDDENPIVVYLRENSALENPGIPFEEVCRDPESILKTQ